MQPCRASPMPCICRKRSFLLHHTSGSFLPRCLHWRCAVKHWADETKRRDTASEPSRSWAPLTTTTTMKTPTRPPKIGVAPASRARVEPHRGRRTAGSGATFSSLCSVQTCTCPGSWAWTRGTAKRGCSDCRGDEVRHAAARCLSKSGSFNNISSEKLTSSSSSL